MTFEELRKANESIRTMNIKGKEYAEVNQRIKAFRMLFPNGFIKTEILSLADGVCTMVATVGFYEDGREVILGTGTAQEKESSSFINKTSFVENTETSCVGRALGMVGIGIDTSVASYEEVENAINNQNFTPASETDVNELMELCRNKKIKWSSVLKNHPNPETWSHDDVREWIDKIGG